MSQTNQNQQRGQGGNKGTGQKSAQQQQSGRRTQTTGVDPKQKFKDMVDEGGLVFKLDLVQTKIATQMFKSNDYFMSRMQDNTGLGTKSFDIPMQYRELLDYRRYAILLQLNELNKELASAIGGVYTPPTNFHESLTLEEVNAFIANNKIELAKKTPPARPQAKAAKGTQATASA